jgi:predicted O-methyltransferase YrrM
VYASFFRLKSFLGWWLEAVDEHSLHSPFFFDLYTRQIKPPVHKEEFAHIERLRQKLLHDQREIPVRDLGAGAHNKPRFRRVSNIARTSLSQQKYSVLYHRLIRQINAHNIIELGTSLGINTLYLAETQNAHVTTFEGAPAIADIATLTFEFAQKENINLVVGNIDRTLPSFLQKSPRVDFAFMDANHRYDPTIRYFDCILRKIHEHSVVVIDDIHHSPEMEKAWNEVRGHRLVHGSLDLFRCGVLFFDPSLNKQHVILQV